MRRRHPPDEDVPPAKPSPCGVAGCPALRKSAADPLCALHGLYAAERGRRQQAAVVERMRAAGLPLPMGWA